MVRTPGLRERSAGLAFVTENEYVIVVTVRYTDVGLFGSG
jgi:hypothetical protein